MVIISILVWDTPDYANGVLDNLLVACPLGGTPHEIYVLDQGSGWKTRRVLKRYRDRIKLLQVKRNIGFPAGHNLVYQTAMKAQPFDAICVINSDVRFLEPNWLDKLSDVLNAEPNAALTGPQAMRVIREGERHGHGHDADGSGPFDFLSGCTTLIKADVVERLGLYDNIFTPGYFEDADICFRYAANGYRMTRCPVQFEHGYLGAKTSTAKIKKDVLRKAYGNFRERNRQEFLKRWAHRL